MQIYTKRHKHKSSQHFASFGHDGKPLYVSGPNDDGLMISFVIDTLTRTCGEGNFICFAGFGAPDGFEDVDD